MNKEEILEELRTKRESLQEQAPQNVVIQNIKLLGEVELLKKQSENEVEQDSKKVGKLYLIEEYNTETDKIMIKYYLDDEFVGISNEGDFLPTGIARESYENIDSIKDILDGLKIEEQNIEQDKEDEIGDRQRVYDLNKLEEEQKEDEREESDSKDEEKTDDVIKDKKLSNLKGEVDLDQQVNGETLRKILGLGEEYDSIAPVRAASIGVLSNSEYVFVAIKPDKTCTVLAEGVIEEDRQKGTNPDEKDLIVNNDGSLSEESSLANFRISNRPNLVMSVRLDENSSTRETTISDISGRESRDDDVAQELHKDGDDRIDDDTRNFIREENGIDESDDMKKEQEKHKDAGCENDRVENIDENQSNDTHTHFVVTRDSEVPGKEGKTVEQWAEELGENPDVIVDRLQREADKEDGRTLIDKVKEIESDYEIAGHEHKHN